MGRKSTTNSNMDMDQFMNDFLEGKYLDDQPNSPVAPDLRRAKTSDDVGGRKKDEPTRGLRRTKTNEDAPVRPRRAAPRRSKSGDDGIKRIPRSPKRKSSKNAQQQKMMDPQQVLRMMELYADMDNSGEADKYLHYGSEKSCNTRGSRGSTKSTASTARSSTNSLPPTDIIIENSTAA